MAQTLREETGRTDINWKNAEEVYRNTGRVSQSATTFYDQIQKLKFDSTTRSKGFNAKEVENVGRQVEETSDMRFKGRFSNFFKKRFGKSFGDIDNSVFQDMLNGAGKSGSASPLGQEEVKAFYASTMDLWQGTAEPGKDITAEIRNAFGVDNTEQVYRLLMQEELTAGDFGFSDEELFQEWLEDLDNRANLSKRREIVQEELQRLDTVKRRGGTTDSEQYNGDDESDDHYSYITNIILRTSLIGSENAFERFHIQID